MDRYNIKRKYAYDYMYDTKGDKQTVDDFVEGYCFCQNHLNEFCYLEVLESIHNSLQTRYYDAKRLKESENPCVLQEEKDKADKIIDETTKVIYDLDKTIETLSKCLNISTKECCISTNLERYEK